MDLNPYLGCSVVKATITCLETGKAQILDGYDKELTLGAGCGWGIESASLSRAVVVMGHTQPTVVKARDSAAGSTVFVQGSGGERKPVEDKEAIKVRARPTWATAGNCERACDCCLEPVT